MWNLERWKGGLVHPIYSFIFFNFQSNWNEIVDNFDDMNLKESLLRGIYAYGFEKPSAIQQRAIIPCIKAYDTIAQAQSGTGKTSHICYFHPATVGD